MDITASPEQKAILGLLSKNLFNIPFTVDNDIDWESVYKESRSQTVLPLVFSDKTLLSSLPDDFRTKIESAIMRYAKSSMNNRRSHAYLHKLLTDAGIDYCILKGVVSAHYYPQPFLRVMGDVDFYVDPSEFDRVHKMLLDNGFSEVIEIERTEAHHHVIFKKPGITLEMHYEIAGTPNSDTKEAVANMFSDICENASLTNGEFVTFMMPSSFHHGLIMLLHLQNHMINQGVGLRHLCDWAVFVNSFKNYEFTDIFTEKLKKIGLWNFCKIVTNACVMALSMPKPVWLDQVDDDVTSIFVEEILSGGNFGRKIGNRRYEGMMISVKGRDNKDRSIFAKGFATLNHNARVHWPILKKIPLLYPVAWVYCFVRLAVLIIIGKRPKLNISDSIKSSNQRKDFYESLKLFEPEK